MATRAAQMPMCDSTSIPVDAGQRRSAGSSTVLSLVTPSQNMCLLILFQERGNTGTRVGSGETCRDQAKACLGPTRRAVGRRPSETAPKRALGSGLGDTGTKNGGTEGPPGGPCPGSSAALGTGERPQASPGPGAGGSLGTSGWDSCSCRCLFCLWTSRCPSLASVLVIYRSRSVTPLAAHSIALTLTRGGTRGLAQWPGLGTSCASEGLAGLPWGCGPGRGLFIGLLECPRMAGGFRFLGLWAGSHMACCSCARAVPPQVAQWCPG